MRPHGDITVKVYPKVSNDGGWRDLIGPTIRPLVVAAAAAEDGDRLYTEDLSLHGVQL